MCRMMAVVAKKVIKADWIAPVESLAVRGKTRSDMPEPGHHDGWGMVAYFRENFPEYLDREPHSVTQDEENFKKGAAAIQAAKAKVAMIHFRKISVGKPQISNTHPFLYKEWSFCHNGTIFDSDKIPLLKLKPGGATDSERFFLYIMEHLDPANIEKSVGGAIWQIKRDFKYTSLTFLLSNGKSIYAYRECDPQYDDYYTLYAATIDGSRVISSEPLPQIAPNWDPVPNGAFIELRA